MEKGALDLLQIEEEVEGQEFEEDALDVQDDTRDDEDGEERALYDKDLFANEVIDDEVDFE